MPLITAENLLKISRTLLKSPKQIKNCQKLPKPLKMFLNMPEAFRVIFEIILKLSDIVRGSSIISEMSETYVFENFPKIVQNSTTIFQNVFFF